MPAARITAPPVCAASRLRLRLVLAPGLPLGPGKADLMAAIATTGSMAAAARQLGMSYQRAHALVASLNTHFAQPVVAPAKGGAQGGGSVLTPFGQELLARYQALLAAAHAAAAPHLAWMDTHSAPAAGCRPQAGNQDPTP